MKAERRHQEERAKAKAKRKLIRVGAPTTPKAIGKAAAMHGTCDCWMCKHKDPKDTRQINGDLQKLNKED